MKNKSDKPDKMMVVEDTFVMFMSQILLEMKLLHKQVDELNKILVGNKGFSEILSKTNDMLSRCNETIIYMHRNMKDCQNMIQEFKGIIAIVRPEVKKGGWYGEEVEVEVPTPKSKLKLSKK